MVLISALALIWPLTAVAQGDAASDGLSSSEIVPMSVPMPLNAPAMSVKPPKVSPAAGDSSQSVDQGAYPRFRVTPQFPRQAQERGISGCVIYGFTINKFGNTSDIYVIEASSPLFERNGILAVEQFKYEPFLVNGELAATPNQTIRLVWAPEGQRLPDHPACAG